MSSDSQKPAGRGRFSEPALRAGVTGTAVDADPLPRHCGVCVRVSVIVCVCMHVSGRGASVAAMG